MQKLFNYMQEQHGVTLIESEMHEIIEIVKEEDFGYPNVDMFLEVIVNHFGFLSQLEMVVEECSELIQAIQKYKRRPEHSDIIKFKNDLVSEIADVKIMIRQMEHFFSKSEINEQVKTKLDRLKSRMTQ